MWLDFILEVIAITAHMVNHPEHREACEKRLDLIQRQQRFLNWKAQRMLRKLLSPPG